MDRRSASPGPAQAFRTNNPTLTKPRPISYCNPAIIRHQHSNSIMKPSPPSLLSLSQLSPLPFLINPTTPTTKSTLVDVVVEGMGGGNDPGEGWQVPPELVFFLRSLGERLDPFSPTGKTSNSAPAGHTKSLTAALNHATLRPTTDQAAILALFTELVVTERAYLRRITALNQSYAIPLKSFSKSNQTKIIDKYETTSMFGKIEAVVSANQSLLACLEKSLQIIEQQLQQQGEQHWADALSDELLNIQRPYRDYLAGYDIIKETEQKLLKKSEAFRQFCERTKETMYDDGMGRVGLRELLMEPVQRITRYILIFEQMLKKMSSNDPARNGLLACIATCNRLAVCELDDHTIKAATMWGLHRSIEGFPPIFIKPGRYLIDSIDVLDIIPDNPSPTILHCTLFLFNDTMLIAKKPPNHHLTGRGLAGLDDYDKLVAAMKKSKSTTSSLNSVVSGGTDFFSKSLGGHNNNTPTKVKKGSMRFKGLVDVHDVIVSNEPTQSGIGPTSEVSFDLYFERPPENVSERWTDRRYRHYVVCPPPTLILSGHEKSLSLSSHPTPSSSNHQAGGLPPTTSHSLSHKSNIHHLNSNQSILAALAERDRFLDNLRKSQALVKAADDRSTVMRTKFINENEILKPAIDSFWNLYDKQTYLAELRKHRVVLQLVGTDAVDPLQFSTESIDPMPPLMIIRAHFNDPDDPDCRVQVRRKPNHIFPSLNNNIPFEKVDEDIVVQTECLSGLIVRIIQAYGIADIPPRGTQHIFTTTISTSQQQPQQTQAQYAGGTNPPSPSRAFRTKSGSIALENNANSALPHRLFTKEGLQRTKSMKSSHTKGSSTSSIGYATTASQPGTPSVALREIQPTATRSPGGPVWYRNSHNPSTTTTHTSSRFAPTKEKTIQDSNRISIYEDLPRLREEEEVNQRSSSPAAGSTLKGKGRAGCVFDADEDEDRDFNNGQTESESQCSSVSGLSSYDDDEEEDGVEEEDGSIEGGRSRTRAGGLVGPRELIVPVHQIERSNSLKTRSKSEPPSKEKPPKTCNGNPKMNGINGGYRVPQSIKQSLDSDRFLETTTGITSRTGSRNPSGSSLGKRSRSVDGDNLSTDIDNHTLQPDHDRVKRVQTLPLVVRKPPPSSSNQNKKNSPNSRHRRKTRIPSNSLNTSTTVGNHVKTNSVDHQDDNSNDNTLSGLDLNLTNPDPKHHKNDLDLDLGGEFQVSEIGTTDLFNDVKGRMKLLKNQLKKLKQEINKIDHSSVTTTNEESTGSGSGLIGSRNMNGSIPRSPRKLHLSEVAKDPSHLLRATSLTTSSTSTQKESFKNLNGLLSEIEKSYDGIHSKFKLIESSETKSFKNQFEKYNKSIDIMKKEVQKYKNEVEVIKTQSTISIQIQESLETENSHLYDAFNEELDKMFNDIQLSPPSQSLNLLIEDLKRFAEERGKLSTLLGATQRQLELETAKSECLENLLREAGLLT
ncbi:hypothetical protein MJO28_005428 [Puccinia striiformis f. sp. tritici]|uniref:Uncharacterized protein n=1 Tax=Puccinia striiformis f. sp. tritici TaxID=168172 RepID=A0ACC0EKP8_9BASI|nr:hypothetical protein Pst134EA_009587 [Puccinia striiformis f. sp. tritici]KAH9469064.1 hypothetical protein Pst134EA_009587 [Puccinia striiformis f. sp. tritici]KAI7955028.1 hypothetical protein MJO28_005428 [Puccinia striiformis f. sp. tritici]KAI9621458.1 hypothetical protein H4Q26_015761 [Puccinia striiformis f. sp. tritici PST-130]